MANTPDIDDEHEEEEYEIEEIIDAQKGRFSKGRMGYFVRWKGYSDSENSWVDEDDAGNAKDLIDAFWERMKDSEKYQNMLKKSVRKSWSKKTTEQTKSPSAPVSASASVSASVPRKRGRKSAEVPEPMDVDDEEPKKPAKKSRKKEAVPPPDESFETPNEETLVTMDSYMDMPSWEDIVKCIDTVEQDVETQTLQVYLTLKKDNIRARVNSSICAEKIPQRMIAFYEKNLRWRSVESEE